MKIRKDFVVIAGMAIIFVLSLQFILALTIPQEKLNETLPTQFTVNYVASDLTVTSVDYGCLNKDDCTITISTDSGGGASYKIQVTLYDKNNDFIYASPTASADLYVRGAGSGQNSTAVVAGHIFSPILNNAVVENGDTVVIKITETDIAINLEDVFIQVSQLN